MRITPPQWDPYDVIQELCKRVNEMEVLMAKSLRHMEEQSKVISQMSQAAANQAEAHRVLVEYVKEHSH